MAVGLLTVVISLGSCKKDVLNSKELLVYLNGDYAAADNTVLIPFVHTPVSVLGNTMVDIPVYATHEVPADIRVTIEPDMTLVDEFNQMFNTNYLPIPQNTYKVVNPGALTISAGNLASSAPMQIEITNPDVLTDPKGYLLPMAITNIEGEDKGARISTNRSAAFLTITYEFNNIENSETPLTGNLVDRSSWTVDVSNTTNNYPASRMIDNNYSTSWRSSNSSSAAKWVMVDMGSVQQIEGLLFSPNYVSTNENPTKMIVSVSVDNVNWEEQGEWSGTAPSASSNASNPDIKGVNFIAPVQAQYFRLDITERVGGNRVGMGELEAVE